jgi:hypothetical protein
VAGFFSHSDVYELRYKIIRSVVTYSSPDGQLFWTWACMLLEVLVMRCYQFLASGPVCLAVRVLFDRE